MTVEFLPAGTTSWTPPVGVTSVQVEIIGSGGRGWQDADGMPNNTYGSGGGGGGYSLKSAVSVTPGTPVSCQVSGGGAEITSWFSSTSTVLAYPGLKGQTGGAGGAAGVGDTTYAGGNGGGDTAISGAYGTSNCSSGGGGSAGPSGVGKDGGTAAGGDYSGSGGGSNGGSSTSGTRGSGAAGGAGNSGSGGGAGAVGNSVFPGVGTNGGGGGSGSQDAGKGIGAAGGMQTVWTQTSDSATAGPGGGGGGTGAVANVNGGNGGGYGGGGGGARFNSGPSYGTGAPGIIVLTYNASTGTAYTQNASAIAGAQASLARTPTKRVQALATRTTSLERSTSHKTQALAATTKSLKRATNRKLSAVATTTTSQVTGKAYVRAWQALAVGLATRTNTRQYSLLFQALANAVTLVSSVKTLAPVVTTIVTDDFNRADTAYSTGGWGITTTGNKTWQPDNNNPTATGKIQSGQGVLQAGKPGPLMCIDLGYAEVDVSFDINFVSAEPPWIKLSSTLDDANGIFVRPAPDGVMQNVRNSGLDDYSNYTPIAAGAHTFRIVRLNQVVTFYVDGAVVSVMTMTSNLKTATWLQLGVLDTPNGLTTYDNLVVKISGATPLTQIISAVASAVASRNVALARSFNGTVLVSSSVSQLKTLARTLQALANAVASYARMAAFARTLQATVTTITSMYRSIGKSVLAITAPIETVQMNSMRARSMQALAAGAASMSYIKTTAAIVYTRALSTIVGVVGTVNRSIGRSASASTIPTAVLMKMIARPIISVTYPSASAAKASLFLRSFAATGIVISTVTNIKAATRNVQALAITVGSLVRSTSKSVRAQASVAMTMIRAMTRQLQGVVVAQTSVVMGKSYIRSILAQASTIVSFAKTPTKLVNAVTTATVTITRVLGKRLQALGTVTTTVQKAMTRSLQATSATTTTINTGSRSYKGIAIATVVASMARTSNKSFSATVNIIPSIAIRQIMARLFQASATAIGIVRKATTRALQGSAGAVTSAVNGKSLVRLVQASASALASIITVRSRSYFLQASTSPVSVMVRALALYRSMQANTLGLGQVSKTTAKRVNGLAYVQTSSTTNQVLYRVFQAQVAVAATTLQIKVLLRVAQASSGVVATVSLVKSFVRALQASSAPLTSMTRFTSKKLLGTSTPAASAQKATSKSFNATSLGIATSVVVGAAVRVVQAAANVVASVASHKNAGIIIQAATNGIASFSKLLGRNIQSNTTPIASAIKGRPMMLRATATVVATANGFKSFLKAIVRFFIIG
jgi:hypothetical protein